MKRILGLAALLGQALGAATGVQPFSVKPGGRGANKRPVYGNAYFSGSRPTDARWWHDLEQPGQCARLQAAKDKRQRRAEKLYRDARYSGGQNYYAYAANILNVNK